MAEREIRTRLKIQSDPQQREARRGFERIKRMARQTNDQLRKIGETAKRVAIGFTGILAGSVKLYAKQEIAERRLVGALKARGRFTDDLFKKYKKVASQIQESTTWGDEDILGAQTTLLRMGDISDEQMPRILELTADWASFMGQDVAEAARLVARTMADPVKNLSLLSRYGIQVNDELKEQITSLVEAGRLEEARLIVARELESVVKGTAREIADTDTGKWVQLKNLWGDIGEVLGKRVLERLRPIADWLTKIALKLLDNKQKVTQFADVLITGLKYAFAAIIATKILMFFNALRVALIALRVQGMNTRKAFRLMWGAATFGLTLAIPLIIENWGKLVASFKIIVNGVKDMFGRMVDSITASATNVFNEILYRAKLTWHKIKTTLGFQSIEPESPAISIHMTLGGETETTIREKMSEMLEDVKAIGGELADVWNEATTFEDDDYQFEGDPTGAGGEEDLKQKELEAERLRQEELAALREQEFQRQEELGRLREDALSRMAEFERKTQAKRIKDTRTYLSNFTALMQSGSKKLRAIGKAAAIIDLGIRLATDPPQVYSRTMAAFAWMGPAAKALAIAAAGATALTLLDGIAQVKKYHNGGVTSAGLAFLEDRELVVPRQSFDQVVDTVAAARGGDETAGGEQTINLTLELDGREIANHVLEYAADERVI